MAFRYRINKSSTYESSLDIKSRARDAWFSPNSAPEPAKKPTSQAYPEGRLMSAPFLPRFSLLSLLFWRI